MGKTNHKGKGAWKQGGKKEPYFVHYKEQWEALTGKAVPVPPQHKPKKKKKKATVTNAVPVVPKTNPNVNALWRWDNLEDVN
jgi:hypothetical protein